MIDLNPYYFINTMLRKEVLDTIYDIETSAITASVTTDSSTLMKEQLYLPFRYKTGKQENQFYAIDVNAAIFITILPSWGLCLNFFPQRQLRTPGKPTTFSVFILTRSNTSISLQEAKIIHPIRETISSFHLLPGNLFGEWGYLDKNPQLSFSSSCCCYRVFYHIRTEEN